MSDGLRKRQSVGSRTTAGRQEQPRAASGYQPHIDGLRAVAVLVVILFHLGVPGFSGGYIGVDVFFVISGFLITGLIWKEIDRTGRFSFKNFYIRRMRRLLPALSATLVLCTIAGAALLSPERFQQFGKSLGAAALSVSNILFWRESGYFDTGAFEKPLLHTWSLSVEEQFYLVWPALLLVFGRRSVARCVALLAVLAIVSLVCDYFLIQQRLISGSTTFFLTPFRAYEFAIGGFGIFILRRMTLHQASQELAMALGLAMILFSAWAYSSELPFPYYYALLPCIGALLVILAPQARLGIVLTNPIALGIGLISYSAYLVHWPLIVFVRYYTFERLDAAEKVGIFVATFGMAIAFYYFIEQPFRRPRERVGRPPSQKRFVTAGLAIIAGLAVLGLQIGTSGGWAWRNDTAMTAQQIKAAKDRRYTYTRRGCSVRRLDSKFCHNDRPIQALVIGNSQEPAGYNIFRTVSGDDANLNLISFGTTNNCDITFVDGRPKALGSKGACPVRIKTVTDQAFLSNLDFVVFSAYKPFRPTNKVTWKLLSYFKEENPNLKVIVVGGYFGTKRYCSELFARFGTYDACKDDRFVGYSPFGERTARGKVDEKGLDYFYIDTSKLACPSGTKDSCVMSANGEPAFYDRLHLSFGFSQFLGERIKDQYGDALNDLGFPVVGKHHGREALGG